MNPNIQDLRAKYGVPTQGYGSPSDPSSTSIRTNRLSTLDTAWNTPQTSSWSASKAIGNYGNEFLGQFKEASNQFANAFESKNASGEEINPLVAGMSGAGAIIKGAFSPLNALVGGVVKEGISKLPPEYQTKLADALHKISTSPEAQFISTVAKEHPNLASSLGSIVDIGSLFLGGKAAEEVGMAAKKEVGSTIGNVAKKFVAPGFQTEAGGMEKALAGEITATMAKQQSDKILETAIKDATPNYEASTLTQKGNLLNRTKEGGLLSERSVVSSDLEKEAGAELAKVPGYNPNATKLAKYQATREEIGRQAQSLRDSLTSEKNIIPKKQIVSTAKTAIKDSMKNSLLLQTSDPAIKNYLRVLKNAVTEETGTPEGLLNVRQSLDQTYENTRGRLAFGSDKISALDEIHTASRDALTKLLIENAPNTEVKASLRSQWNLYRALDQLQIDAEKEAGSSIGRFMKAHPIITKGVKGTIRAAGIGEAVNLLP